MVRIGVIADTHGLLRDEAIAALAGSELILHAGDVGAPDGWPAAGSCWCTIARPWARVRRAAACGSSSVAIRTSR